MLPRHREVLGYLAAVSPQGWAGVGVALFAVGFMVPLGTLADLLGARAVVVLGALGMLAGVLLTTLAQPFAVLLRNLAQEAQGDPDPEATPRKRLEARLADDPDNYHLLDMLAYELFAEGDLERAGELYLRCIELQPSNPRPRYQLARCLEREGELEAALVGFREALARDHTGAVRDQAAWWIEVLEGRREGANGA